MADVWAQPIGDRPETPGRVASAASGERSHRRQLFPFEELQERAAAGRDV